MIDKKVMSKEVYFDLLEDLASSVIDREGCMFDGGCLDSCQECYDKLLKQYITVEGE